MILNMAYPNDPYDVASWVADTHMVKSGNLAELEEKVREALASPGA